MENRNQRRDDAVPGEPLWWEDVHNLGALRVLLADDAYVVQFQSLQQYRQALLKHVDRLMGAQQEAAERHAAIRTWRNRIGVSVDWPLHAPNDVERAMVAENDELRRALREQEGGAA